jgi:phospholipase C
MKAFGSTCLFGLLALAASAAVVAAAPPGTTTPIQHLVVIFQENNSFDHYFGTYPVALNPPGEPLFFAWTTRRRSMGSALWSTECRKAFC